MSRQIYKECILNIQNHKLFLLYREKLEFIIKELDCSVKEIIPIEYKFFEDQDFDNNYLTQTSIKRKWNLKSILPESLNILIPSSIDFTTWYDNASWKGIDYDYCEENNLLNSLSEDQLNSYSCDFKITPTLNEENNFYNVLGKNYFIRHGENQTKFIVELSLELNYKLLKEKFSSFGLENVLDSVIDKLVDLITSELEKNMNLIAKQISEKYSEI